MGKFLTTLLLLSVTICNGQAFTLLKDIAPGTVSSSGYRYGFCLYNGRVYFKANDNTVLNNWELWSTDGTPAGTAMVKEIDPAIGSNPSFMTVVNGKILFAANDPTASYEFFASDGSAAGTALLKDIDPGFTSGFSNPSYPNNFSVVNGELFFSATTKTTGTELWRSDGTAAGTALIKDINPGTGSSFPSTANSFPAFNGYMYFAASDGLTGVELWKTDGTSAGTTLVKDINPGAANSNPTYFFGVLNNELYFGAGTAANGIELWKTDGTTAGTVLVKDINPGAGNGLYYTTIGVVSNGNLYFTATDGVTGNEIYKTDGTSAGTVQVKDVNPGAGAGGYILSVAPGGKVYFSGNDGVNGAELWTTDGTAAGTVLVKDINPGAASSNPSNPANIGGILVFNATTAAYGAEPWRSDGTTANTTMIEDVAAGTVSSNPGEYNTYNGLVFTSMTTPATGYELWVSTIAIVVPLRLLSFEGTLLGRGVQLTWHTAEEVNTDQFIVESSEDGNHFSPIGRVAANNQAGEHHYGFTDPLTVLAGPVRYYRLKQTDTDGRFTYSPVVVIKVPVTRFSASLSPNPASSSVQVIIRSGKAGRGQLRVTGMDGRNFLVRPVQVAAGINRIDLDIKGLAPGIYCMLAEVELDREMLRMVKQ